MAAHKPNGTRPANTTPPSEGKLTLREAVQAFEGQLIERRAEFAPSLPSHITPERFQRVVATACNLNPQLLKANRLSLLNACAKAASDGLLPDGREGALVIFNSKEGQKVQWMPMVAGIIKKARQSGEISVLDAQIVFENEIAQGRFTYKRVDGVPKIDHEPIIQGPRGPAVLVYSVVKFKDGSIDYEVLHADDVAKIRNVSRAKNAGPWSDWTEEMWKKSAIRRHAKRLPISSELFDAISRDDEMTEFDKQRKDAEDAMLAAARKQLGGPIEGEIIEAEVEDATDTRPEPLRRAERLLAQCKTKADVDDLIQSIRDELTSDYEIAALETMGHGRLGEM